MRKLIFILFLQISFFFYGQNIKEIYPVIGKSIERTEKGEIEFNEARKKCEKVWEKVSNDKDYENLNKIEKNIFDNCDESKENYWSILEIGCSWYCGGGQDKQFASSELKSNNGISYGAKNIHDLNYKTAWIEGVSGHGIGEFITYNFPPQTPRINEIIIVNGYVKSEKVWKENSRVKKLKMYYNEKLIAILNLQDIKNEQHFKIKTLGYNNRKNWDELITKKWWKIKFEIFEVYKGEKFEDTAITEIYFNGIHDH